MLALLAVVTLAVSYKFPTEPMAYTLKADFKGYIPVLGGQENADVNVVMGFKVWGIDPEEGNIRAVSDLTDVEIKFGGAPLPFDIDSVRPYFPKNTISLTPEGKIVKSDAPDVSLPVRLPGLDVKRFPEISYLPVEFPVGGFEIGKSFEYKKAFGDSDVTYVVTPQKQEGSTLLLKVSMKQEYNTLEDEAKNLVTKDVDAFAKVKTLVSGEGVVEFDSEKGRVIRSKTVADATSTAVEIKSGATTKRELKTTVSVEAKK
jgi:hypothetical protein